MEKCTNELLYQPGILTLDYLKAETLRVISGRIVLKSLRQICIPQYIQF